MSKDHENQPVALVTGASRGIGKAIALRLAKEGSFVLGTGTSESSAQQIQQYFEEAGLKGSGMVLNLSQRESIEPFLEKLEAQYGNPSILVNNAGITRDNLLLRMEDEEWDSVIETNLSALFRLTRACIKPMFRARWGRVINISSVVASMGNAGQTNYAAAKAGIIGFSKALACEIASRGITVNVVAPGFIDTDMTKNLPDAVRQELLKRVPVRSLGQPEDVAAAVAFLASKDAGYITGETVHVNGGLYMA